MPNYFSHFLAFPQKPLLNFPRILSQSCGQRNSSKEQTIPIDTSVDCEIPPSRSRRDTNNHSPLEEGSKVASLSGRGQCPELNSEARTESSTDPLAEFRSQPPEFPGWTAAAIHQALSEAELSAEAHRILNRVGEALGKREGTGPDDTPWLRTQRDRSRAAGRHRGRLEGEAEGRADGERNLLIFLAENRFGQETGQRLSELLEKVGASEEMQAAAKWIIESDTGPELIRKAQAAIPNR